MDGQAAAVVAGPLLGEITAEGWVLILGGLGTLLTGLIAALATWWLKLKAQDLEARKAEGENERARLELQHKLDRRDTEEARRSRNAIVKELEEVIDGLRSELTRQREEIHGLRNELGQARTQIAICDHERRFQSRQIKALAEALRKADVDVVMPMDSGVQTPPPPKGGET